MAAGSWTLAQALFDAGDPAFVDEVRIVHAPEQLGAVRRRQRPWRTFVQAGTLTASRRHVNRTS